MGSRNRHSIRAEIGDYDDDVLLTEPEAAEAGGFSAYTLKDWRLKGGNKGPPAIKVYGSTVRYRVGDVRAWLKTLAKTAEAETA